MDRKEWAKEEIELFNVDKTEKERALANDALNIYLSLSKYAKDSEDFDYIKGILDMLFAKEPMTEVEDTEDSWELFDESEQESIYTHKRLEYLQKIVTADGKVFYSDTNRVIVGGASFGCGGVLLPTIRAVVDILYPITFPYVSADKLEVNSSYGAFEDGSLYVYINSVKNNTYGNEEVFCSKYKVTEMGAVNLIRKNKFPESEFPEIEFPEYEPEEIPEIKEEEETPEEPKEEPGELEEIPEVPKEEPVEEPKEEEVPKEELEEKPSEEPVEEIPEEESVEEGEIKESHFEESPDIPVFDEDESSDEKEQGITEKKSDY